MSFDIHNITGTNCGFFFHPPPPPCPGELFNSRKVSLHPPVWPSKGALFSLVKPLSARIRSPGRRLLRTPQCSVIYLSDAQPPQALDKNYIVPWGSFHGPAFPQISGPRHFIFSWARISPNFWASSIYLFLGPYFPKFGASSFYISVYSRPHIASIRPFSNTSLPSVLWVLIGLRHWITW